MSWICNIAGGAWTWACVALLTGCIASGANRWCGVITIKASWAGLIAVFVSCGMIINEGWYVLRITSQAFCWLILACKTTVNTCERCCKGTSQLWYDFIWLYFEIHWKVRGFLNRSLSIFNIIYSKDYALNRFRWDILRKSIIYFNLTIAYFGTA